MPLFIGSGRIQGDPDDTVFVIDVCNIKKATNVIINALTRRLESENHGDYDPQDPPIYLIYCEHLANVIINDGDTSLPKPIYQDLR